jgi:hypothetical protein
MGSQAKGIGSADISASTYDKIRTIPARLHCASHRRDNACGEPRPIAGAMQERTLLGVGSSAWFGAASVWDIGLLPSDRLTYGRALMST